MHSESILRGFATGLLSEYKKNNFLHLKLLLTCDEELQVEKQ